jgi:hypothetical protein
MSFRFISVQFDGSSVCGEIDEISFLLWSIDNAGLSSMVVSVACHTFAEGGPDATPAECDEWENSLEGMGLKRVSKHVRQHDGQYFTSDGECFLRMFDAAKNELEIDREMQHFAAQQYADEPCEDLSNEMDREQMERDYYFNSMDYV